MELVLILENSRTSMNKTIDFFKMQLTKVRTGRASTNLVDGLKIDYYGSPTPLSQAATVSAPDARTIVIQPYDRGLLGSIEKAIQHADLGFNPQNNGTIIRISVPPLTEERRKEFVKLCKKYAEENKVSIRNISREVIDLLKKGEKDKTYTEDDRKSGEEKIQKLTDEYVKIIDEVLAKKEKELLD